MENGNETGLFASLFIPYNHKVRYLLPSWLSIIKDIFRIWTYVFSAHCLQTGKSTMPDEDIGSLTAIGDHAAFLREVDAACERATNTIVEGVAATGERRAPYAQGNYAESHHAATYNVDSVLNRMGDVEARVLQSNGYKSPDIVLKENGKALRSYSLKYYKSGKASVDAQKRYGEQERLIPDEQLEAAREYIKQQVAKDRATGRSNRLENAAELERIEDRLTGNVQEGTAESETLSREESEQRLKEVRRGERPDVQPQIDGEVIARESLRSGGIAAGITLGLAVAPRIYEELRYWNGPGEWSINELPGALRRVFHDPAKLAAESGVRGALATSITLLARKGAFGEAARDVSPPLVGTLTYLTVEGGKDYLKYRSGGLSGEWFADGMMRKSVGAATGAYGAALGQVVIPIPIIGSMIGASLGSIVANNGYQFAETATENFYREEQLRELAGAYTELSTAWMDLESRYEYWLEHDAFYRNRVDEYRHRQDKHDQDRIQLNQELRNSLNDDE